MMAAEGGVNWFVLLASSVITFVLGLASGLLVAWTSFRWRQRAEKRQRHEEALKAAYRLMIQDLPELARLWTLFSGKSGVGALQPERQREVDGERRALAEVFQKEAATYALDLQGSEYQWCVHSLWQMAHRPQDFYEREEWPERDKLSEVIARLR
jgi:hypothetical protein